MKPGNMSRRESLKEPVARHARGWKCLLLLALTGTMPFPASSAAISSNAPPVKFLSSTESDVVKELNLARTAPKTYAKYLKDLRTRYQPDNSIAFPGQPSVTTKESVQAVDEAIEFLLKKATPAPPLNPSQGMSEAARDHATDQGKTGGISHTGTDDSAITNRLTRYGEWQITCGENIACGWDEARSIVMQLIIDDNVPSRGHRKNIFNADYRVVGVAIAPHAKYRHICVMDFAGGYVDKSKAARKAASRHTRR